MRVGEPPAGWTELGIQRVLIVSLCYNLRTIDRAQDEQKNACVHGLCFLSRRV